MAEFKKPTPRNIRSVQRDRLSWHQFTAAEDRYDTMTYRRCGASGLKLPAISLGAWETFGGYRGPEIARECIFRAFNLGITHFDLANNYGHPPGRAETVVGRVLREMPREELIISTKAGYRMWPGPYGEGSSRKYLVASLEQSLLRLGLDYVDIYYSHRFDEETPLEETLDALDQLVRQGKALYAGLSNYPADRFTAAHKILQEKQRTPIVVHQCVYNLFTRDLEKDVLSAALETGVGVIVYSPLAQGLLTDKYLQNMPDESRAAKLWTEDQRATHLPERRLAHTRKLNEIAKSRGQTLAQMALAWTLRDPAVTSALIGASSVEQVEENVKALARSVFTAEELARIEQVFNS